MNEKSGPSWATARWTSRNRSAPFRSPAAKSSTTSIFVINCNLQRLDGPVRGNGKIIQELEADFRGAGWNVIKVIWGTTWDELLARDYSGRLRQLMEECVDGEYQDFKSKSGAYIREKFFGRYPETAEMVRDWSDEKIWRLTRGGHDSKKIYAAYKAAVEHKGQPTVILAKTVKGYGMGSAGEAQMMAHQAKKMSLEALKQFRDRFNIPVVDSETRASALHQIPRRVGGDELSAGRAARRSAAICRRAGARASRWSFRRCRPSRRSSRRPTAAKSPPPWLRAGAEHAVARQEYRQAHRADRAGRVPHLRHGGHVPPIWHFLAGRPALPPAGRRPALLLQGRPLRPDAAGRHQRGRRHGARGSRRRRPIPIPTRR